MRETIQWRMIKHLLSSSKLVAKVGKNSITVSSGSNFESSQGLNSKCSSNFWLDIFKKRPVDRLVNESYFYKGNFKI